MRPVLMLAAAAIVAALIVPRSFAKLDAMQGARSAAAVQAAHPTAARPPAAADSRSVTLWRNAQGHFQVNGRVDGRHLDFMIDTGASVIALTAKDADYLGIHPAARDFTVLVKTANGMAKAAPVVLDMVEIEDIMVRNVDAVVMPDSALTDNLLGMSFLTRLHRWQFADGKLVLEQ
jgi:aspartyl protease family protein